MPPISTIITWPSELREQIDARLRAAHYGDLVALSRWLAQQGREASPSMLCRYAVRLRRADAEMGDMRARLLDSAPSGAQPASAAWPRHSALGAELRSCAQALHQALDDGQADLRQTAKAVAERLSILRRTPLRR